MSRQVFKDPIMVENQITECYQRGLLLTTAGTSCFPRLIKHCPLHHCSWCDGEQKIYTTYVRTHIPAPVAAMIFHFSFPMGKRDRGTMALSHLKPKEHALITLCGYGKYKRLRVPLSMMDSETGNFVVTRGPLGFVIFRSNVKIVIEFYPRGFCRLC
jgi:hypothetical protein